MYNGLFLCRECDKHFEEHDIEILGDGALTVKLKPLLRYKMLRGKKVAWAHLIGVDVDWPTAETLTFRNTLPKVCSKHHQDYYGVEADDQSEASESEIAATRKRKMTVRPSLLVCIIHKYVFMTLFMLAY